MKKIIYLIPLLFLISCTQRRLGLDEPLENDKNFGKNIISVQPMKYIPLFMGDKCVRIEYYLKLKDKSMYKLDFAYVDKPYKQTQFDEENKFYWLKFGLGDRFLFGKIKHYFYLHPQFNIIRYEYKDINYELKFIGAQTYIYLGYQYLGKWVLFSIGPGISPNIGSYEEIDSPTAQNFDVNHVPSSVLGPYISIDMDISLGIRF